MTRLSVTNCIQGFRYIAMSKRPRRLFAQVHEAIRLNHYACSTERTCGYWAKGFILNHNNRRPKEMGEEDLLFQFRFTESRGGLALIGGALGLHTPTERLLLS